jgi:hypothetical protein
MTIRILSAALLAFAAACGEPPTQAAVPGAAAYDGGHTVGSGNRSGDSTTVTTNATGHGFGSGNEAAAPYGTEAAASDSAAGRGTHTIGSGN